MRNAIIAAAWIALGCCIQGPVESQIALPGVRLPPLPLGGVTAPLANTLDNADATLAASSTSLRARNQQRLRQNRALLEADPAGQPMLRGQLLGLGLTPQTRARIAAAGFTLVSQQDLTSLQTSVEVWRVPAGVSTRAGLRALRQLDPAASFDYDHVLSGSGAEAVPEAGTADSAASAAPAPAAAGGAARVGLIDGGLRTTHPALMGAAVTLWGCAGQRIPSAHGTAVASLLVGSDGAFHGALPGAQLYAADVYCGLPGGGAIDTIAAALGWMSINQVAVINISLVGPDNLVLRALVQRMIAGGHLIVAAVGNDGPAAPPLYPASYPQVVGVTAVDARRHVLLEAGRGPQVMFAAPGADMAAASDPQGYTVVRGTSFAAPLVAGLLAAQLSRPNPQAARSAVEALALTAVDLGAAGRDDTYGRGLVAAPLRVAPDILRVAGTPLR